MINFSELFLELQRPVHGKDSMELAYSR